MSNDPLPATRIVLGRALRKRCPQCGSPLRFESWNKVSEECRFCRLSFNHEPGDLWAFWIIGNRVFVGILFLCLFIIFRPTTWEGGVVLFLATMVPLIVSIPNRMAIAIGLDYLSRRHLG